MVDFPQLRLPCSDDDSGDSSTIRLPRSLLDVHGALQHSPDGLLVRRRPFLVPHVKEMLTHQRPRLSSLGIDVFLLNSVVTVRPDEPCESLRASVSTTVTVPDSFSSGCMSTSRAGFPPCLLLRGLGR